MKPVVSITGYQGISSVAEAIELCKGLKNLKPSDRVLLKPNLCTAGKGICPPFGAVTTTAVIEGVVRTLKDYGVKDISIGEGSVLDEVGTSTWKAYRWINVHRLAKRYGLRLIDFNAGPHKRITNTDVPMNIAEAALDTDFFINLPVLKTHFHTKVSLSSKNLKGCLSISSKKYFHGANGALYYNISRLMETVPQHLVVIDGIYAMENGPDPSIGTAHPARILVTSTDFLAADAVGTRLLGMQPIDVEHLRLYAERHGLSNLLVNQEAIEIRGERIGDHVKQLSYTTTLDSNIKSSGHTGLEVRLIGNTLCCGCYGNLTGPLLLLAALSHNQDFHGARIIAGKGLKDDHNFSRTFLFGACAIKENKHLDKATSIKGCPPKFLATCFFLARQLPGLSAQISFWSRFAVVCIKAILRIGVLPLQRYKRYRVDAGYDLKHFCCNGK